MPRLLAEDLLLLCWNDERGRVEQRCSSTLAPGIGGALLLDAVLADALLIDDDRVIPTGEQASDPLVAEAVEEAAGWRRPPKTRRLVQRLGTTKRRDRVRDRLVGTGVLRVDRRRLLGLIPYTRHPVADPGAVDEVRTAVRTLLLGHRDAEGAEVRQVILAALARPTKALELLVERSERKQAGQRAEAFSVGEGVPEAVGDAVKQAQAAAMAAVTSAAAASASSSSSSN